MKIVERLGSDDLKARCLKKLNSQDWAEISTLLRGYFFWSHGRVRGAHLVSYVSGSLLRMRK